MCDDGDGRCAVQSCSAEQPSMWLLRAAVGVAVLVCVFVHAAGKYWRRHRRIVQLIEQIPGPPALPLLGNAIEMSVDHDEMFARIMAGAALYDPDRGLVRGWNGHQPWVAIYTHQFAEVILGNARHIYKSAVYTYLEPWLGRGLLTSSGRHWRARRKIITPAFHFRILDDFLHIFREQSDILVENLAKKPTGVTFDVFPLVTLCTLDIICESAMGIKMHAQSNGNTEYVTAVHGIGSIIQTRQSTLWLQPNIFFRFTSMYAKHAKYLKILHNFSKNVIRERKEELRQRRTCENAFTKGKNKVFLDILLEAAEGGTAVLSDADIREEVDTFMFEGHDTTSAAVSWSLYLLGCYPNVQETVYQELMAIFQQSDRPVTLQDLPRMKYLECCIKETLRLYPVAPMIARELKEDVILDNFTVPTGTTILIVTYMIHRDPTIFTDPEHFRPERFEDTHFLSKHPYAYIPFSAGPRNCIGQKYALMEAKVMLSTILRKFKIKSMDRREDLILLGELILRPKQGIRIQLEPR